MLIYFFEKEYLITKKAVFLFNNTKKRLFNISKLQFTQTSTPRNSPVCENQVFQFQ